MLYPEDGRLKTFWIAAQKHAAMTKPVSVCSKQGDRPLQHYGTALLHRHHLKHL